MTFRRYLPVRQLSERDERHRVQPWPAGWTWGPPVAPYLYVAEDHADPEYDLFTPEAADALRAVPGAVSITWGHQDLGTVHWPMDWPSGHADSGYVHYPARPGDLDD